MELKKGACVASVAIFKGETNYQNKSKVVVHYCRFLDLDKGVIITIVKGC